MARAPSRGSHDESSREKRLVGAPAVVQRFANAADFARAAGQFLSAREAENNLLLGIASDLESGGSFGDEPPYLAVARRGNQVSAAAVRTPPFGVAISASDDPAAIELLADDIHDVYQSIPGVLAPASEVEMFCDRWESVTPQRRKLRAKGRIHRCKTVIRARSPLGEMRPFAESDRQLTLQWSKLFAKESKVSHGESDRELMASIDRRLNARDGGYFFWETEGEVVSMAGCGGRTPTGVRIGPVYTPPNFRGMGYASALVADLTSLMLSRGLDFCCLFTDLANPVSNSIYAQIGYEPVIDCRMYDLEPA